MRRRGLGSVLLLCVVAAAGAQTGAPQTRLSYEDRPGTTGHTLVVDGKSFGPYKEILFPAYSTSGTAAAFVVVKRDRVYVLAQGRETGPLPVGFEIDRLQVADDGKVWVLSATRASDAEDDPAQTLLWVNGKSYGPYTELTTVEYAETGGSWVAAVRTAEDEADVLVSGKPQGPFFSVDHAWLTPDGKTWGYAVSDSEGVTTVVTPEKTWSKVDAGFFANLYPREPHWGYALRFDLEDRIIVDGQTYEGYRGFQGLILTPSGNHWAFEAQKRSDDTPVVVIDGKEYPGEGLSWSRLGAQETFTWTYRDATKTSVQTLRLP
jgi:hypothetical protein